MEPFVLKDEQYLQLENMQQDNHHLIAGFTTKNGGRSKGDFSSFNLGLHVHDNEKDVLANREILSKITGFALDDWVAGEQTHGTKVKVVGTDDKGCGAKTTATALKDIDGLVTKEKGILLTAFFADCIPLYFFDPLEGIVGIAHAGWKGTVGEIAKQVVSVFQRQGSKLENIQVTIGPGISKDYYEVDQRIVDFIEPSFYDKVLTEKQNQHFLLDLKALNREILLNCGILRHNIDTTNYCTHRDESLFFSHRRDNGKTGRMLAFIGLIE
ncbi:peptidoglycan editing factor PgeF [Oceanobacillus sp. CAU 1775]